jgi:glutathione synthase/RimK-type ligase-like ATP-grasp enzyme
MRIGIAKAAPAWVQEFQRACEALGVHYTLVDIHRNDWLNQLGTVDALIWRTTLDDPAGLWEMRSKLPLIEEMGIACYPSTRMLWFYDNKIRETYFLQQQRLPIPGTFITFDESEALKFAAQTEYPIIIKTAGGASASGVAKVLSRAEAEKIISRVFTKRTWLKRIQNRLLQSQLEGGNYLMARRIAKRQDSERYVYFQEMIPAECDWRVTTLGPGLVSAFKRLNRPNDFRASGSGRWVALTENELPLEACKLALKISDSQKFTSMTYDFLQTEQGFVITEFSFSFMLNKIYCDTLFQQEGEKFQKIAPIPVGILHLKELIRSIDPTNTTTPFDKSPAEVAAWK